MQIDASDMQNDAKQSKEKQRKAKQSKVNKNKQNKIFPHFSNSTFHWIYIFRV